MPIYRVSVNVKVHGTKPLSYVGSIDEVSMIRGRVLRAMLDGRAPRLPIRHALDVVTIGTPTSKSDVIKLLNSEFTVRG